MMPHEQDGKEIYELRRKVSRLEDKARELHAGIHSRSAALLKAQEAVRELRESVAAFAEFVEPILGDAEEREITQCGGKFFDLGCTFDQAKELLAKHASVEGAGK